MKVKTDAVLFVFWPQKVVFLSKSIVKIRARFTFTAVVTTDSLHCYWHH